MHLDRDLQVRIGEFLRHQCRRLRVIDLSRYLRHWDDHFAPRLEVRNLRLHRLRREALGNLGVQIRLQRVVVQRDGLRAK